MNEPIVPIDAIRARAAAAFNDGRGRDDHNMNWHASAIRIWQAEWDRLNEEKRGDDVWTLISGARSA